MAEQILARSPRGVVAAAAPTAAVIGADALRAGGNAYDAAVAAALAETVLLPPKCGLAGDLVALVWPIHRDRPAALLAIGGAPAGLAAVAEAGRLDDTGPMSVGVPGAPAGYLALADRAVLPLDRLAAPAIELAYDGFCWSTICTGLARESQDLVARYQPDGTRYYPGGEPIEPGAVVTFPGLARALERLVVDRDGWLHHEIGRAIVDRVQAAGGVLTADDFDYSRAEWAEPAGAAVAGHRLWATPAPTHGPSLLDALSALGSGPEPVMGSDSRVQTDSGWAAVDHARVLAAVRSVIDRRALSLCDPSGTSMVSAVDGEGTLVVVVHSNSYPRFGSGLIVGEYDLILANRAGRGFSSQPGHANFPVAGRRPATTLHAWGWRPEPALRLLGATPGGANQMPWNAQTLARLLATGAGPSQVADAIVAPRWQLDPDGGLSAEPGAEPAAQPAEAEGWNDPDGKRRAGTDVRPSALWALRSAMQIVAHGTGRGEPGRNGTVAYGAADPRTVGLALGL
jgi:gamma-glutamyltranspeptidase/glutathione hydrolase